MTFKTLVLDCDKKKTLVLGNAVIHLPLKKITYCGIYIE